jgi:exopolysaccharide biosynthesis protein
MRFIACAAALALVGVSAPDSRSHDLSVPNVGWRESSAGVERAVFDVSGGGEGWRTRVIAVRLDPSRVRFRLRARLRDLTPAWDVERAPAGAVVAVNAGQFSGYAPWGWLVMDGKEVRSPGRGPLAAALAWDRAGRVRWIDDLGDTRMDAGIVEAIQSYPTLIGADGQVPSAIRRPGHGVDVEHRDGRLAIGTTGDGRVLIALTRFNGLGALSPDVPFGLSLEEMANVMRALGCRRAVSLDGGISAQLLVRESGRTLVWRGWRPVPLGLVAEPVQSDRSPHDPPGAPHVVTE